MNNSRNSVFTYKRGSMGGKTSKPSQPVEQCSLKRQEQELQVCAENVRDRLNSHIDSSSVDLLPTIPGENVVVLTGFCNHVSYDALRKCQDAIFPRAMLWVGRYMEGKDEYFVGVFPFSDKDKEKVNHQVVMHPLHLGQYITDIFHVDNKYPRFFKFLSDLPLELDKSKCIRVNQDAFQIKLIDLKDDDLFRIVLYGCIDFSVAALSRFFQTMAVPLEKVTVCMKMGYIVIDIEKNHSFHLVLDRREQKRTIDEVTAQDETGLKRQSR